MLQIKKKESNWWETLKSNFNSSGRTGIGMHEVHVRREEANRSFGRLGFPFPQMLATMTKEQPKNVWYWTNDTSLRHTSIRKESWAHCAYWWKGIQSTPDNYHRISEVVSWCSFRSSHISLTNMWHHFSAVHSTRLDHYWLRLASIFRL